VLEHCTVTDRTHIRRIRSKMKAVTGHAAAAGPDGKTGHYPPLSLPQT
jgi:hypothetical protein